MNLIDKAIAVLRDPNASNDAKDLAEQVIREGKDRVQAPMPMIPAPYQPPPRNMWDKVQKSPFKVTCKI